MVCDRHYLPTQVHDRTILDSTSEVKDANDGRVCGPKHRLPVDESGYNYICKRPVYYPVHRLVISISICAFPDLPGDISIGGSYDPSGDGGGEEIVLKCAVSQISRITYSECV